MTSVRRLKVRQFIGSSFWLIPSGLVALAVGLALLFPVIDEATNGELTFAYGPSEATELLSAISSGMIVFTGFVFSVVLLIVQFGSTQYSPRLLQAFVTAPVAKVALGLFAATFTYSLLVLPSIESEGRAGFVPSFAVTFAIVLVVASVLFFLLLMQRVYQGLRPGSVVRFIGRRGRKAIDVLHPDPFVDVDQAVAYREMLRDAPRQIPHLAESAVLQAIDAERLVEAAEAADAVIVLAPAVGDFVPYRAPLFLVKESGTSLDNGRLRRSMAWGVERTVHQDPALAFRWLVDIAIKALSPAINDPTTATQAIDQLEDLIRRVGMRQLASGRAAARAGQVRLVYRTPTWQEYVDLTFTEIRRSGAHSVQIHRRLHAVLEDLLDLVPPGRQDAIERQIDLLDEAAREGFTDAERAIAMIGDYQGIGSPRVHGRRRDAGSSGSP
jgi:uncharacterized membrane protein